jgi:dienelactone hydrolase
MIKMHIEKYYTSMEHLLNVFDKRYRKLTPRIESASGFSKWKRELRYKLFEITGMNEMEQCELQPRILESLNMDGYRRDKMIIQTEPDIWMPFYVLIPDAVTNVESTPCIIAAHGHNSAGKFSVSGRIDIPAVKKHIETSDNDYGVRFVREGYIVFCPDARAFGERREWMTQGDSEQFFLGSSCTELNHMAISLGQSVTGMWTWDLMRLVDYIVSSRNNYAKIGCVGLSGGGLQTLWLTAMDDRVSCAVVSGYFYGYKDSLLKLSNNCGCNYVPNLWKYVDIGDLGALIAPRPLLIESGNRDNLNGERGIANVLEQLEITKQAYRLLEAEEELHHYIFEGDHKWDGSQTYRFMNQSIGVW